MSLYSLPCLQEVAGITVLWGVRGAAGLFPCEGMTTAIFCKNRVEVKDEKGHKSIRRSSHVKYIEPSEKNSPTVAE